MYLEKGFPTLIFSHAFCCFVFGRIFLRCFDSSGICFGVRCNTYLFVMNSQLYQNHLLNNSSFPTLLIILPLQYKCICNRKCGQQWLEFIGVCLMPNKSGSRQYMAGILPQQSKDLNFFHPSLYHSLYSDLAPYGCKMAGEHPAPHMSTRSVKEEGTGVKRSN